ncbi:hypothetical protein, partial [Stenotrophomonas maltophilia]|uniref:hypothetical protein n=1 Tax=Stenotrophomonas maltophilia TaxID=40324 RepID=UPI003BF78D8D
SIPNGMNFMAIGKMIIGIFKNKDKIAIKEKVPVQFRAFAAQSYSADFLANSLKLNLKTLKNF